MVTGVKAEKQLFHLHRKALMDKKKWPGVFVTCYSQLMKNLADMQKSDRYSSQTFYFGLYDLNSSYDF